MSPTMIAMGGRIILVLLNLITILNVEWGDHLCTCVSTRVLHLCPLVVVVIKGVANTLHLAENPIKQSPLRDVSTGEETDTTAILPIRNEGDKAKGKEYRTYIC
jgi:hypothetical protein